MPRCQQVVVFFYRFARRELEGSFSPTALESKNQVILARIIIPKSHSVKSGFMVVIAFGLLLTWTSEEYLHGEVLTVLVLKEHNTISALCHSMAFRLRVG